MTFFTQKQRSPRQNSRYVGGGVILFSLVMLCILLSPRTVHADTTTGLVGWWTFDGTQTNWGTGTTNDSSGQGKTGTLTSMSTTTSPTVGKIAQGFTFDGVDDVVKISNFSFLSNFTVSAWTKYTGTTAVDGYRNVVCRGGVFENSTNYCMGLRTELGGMRIHCYWRSAGGTLGGNESDAYLSLFSYMNPLKQRMISCSWDGTNVRFYVDGVLINTKSSLNSQNPVDGSQSVTIGNSNTNTSNDLRFTGLIDDVRVYNRALSAADVKQLYNQGQTKIASSAAQSLTTGLVGYWMFDGKDTNWNTNTTNDLSGQANTGTMVNMSTSSVGVSGKNGQAFNFDGTNDYVNIGSASSLRITGAITISVWAKTSSSASMDMIGSRSASSGGYRFGFIGSSQCLFTYFGVTDWLSSNNCLLSDGKWHLYQVVNNLSTVSFYRDGQLFSTPVAAGNSGSASNTFVTIGALNDQNGCTCVFSNFNGSLDEVRVYNRALSTNELKQVYAQGQAKMATSPKQSLTNGLVAYWTFDGKDITWTTPSAATMVDQSGSGLTGTLQRMTMATSSTVGIVGQGMNFSATYGNYVTTAGSISDANFTGPLTISVWANIKTGGNYRQFAAKHLSNGATDNPFDFRTDNSAAPTLVIVRAGTTLTNSNVGPLVQLGKWAHYVVACPNGSIQAVCTFYVNGVATLGTLQSGNSGSVTGVSAAIRIGRRADDFVQMDGSMDELRIYNRALSASEVKQLYELGKTKIKSL